jgi:hypothetical protein
MTEADFQQIIEVILERSIKLAERHALENAEFRRALREIARGDKTLTDIVLLARKILLDNEQRGLDGN